MIVPVGMEMIVPVGIEMDDVEIYLQTWAFEDRYMSSPDSQSFNFILHIMDCANGEVDDSSSHPYIN